MPSKISESKRKIRRWSHITLQFAVAFSFVLQCDGLGWRSFHCASDANPDMPEGLAPDVGRFPWLGIVQHQFYVGGKLQYAVTTGIVIHQGFALAPAEDMAKILQEQVTNNTKLVVWKSVKEKFVVDVYEYILHPEFEEGLTRASVALLRLGDYLRSHRNAPVPPVCLPVKGGGVFDNLYVIKISDETKQIEKEVRKMIYVENKDCEEFYKRAQLSYEKMAPLQPLCASATELTHTCVWDGGAALVTRLNHAYFTLLGFGVRGAGCGAPARFIYIQRYLPWIDEVVTGPLRTSNEEQYSDTEGVYLRQITPYEIHLYPMDVKVPVNYGNCGTKGARGHVLYKDAVELTMNKNFGQGFYFASISTISQVTCAKVLFDATARTTSGIWVEHNCRSRMADLAVGMRGAEDKMSECFIYFRSTAFVEFRFFFSFRAYVEMTLYGNEDLPEADPNPNLRSVTTEPWWPTTDYFKSHSYELTFANMYSF